MKRLLALSLAVLLPACTYLPPKAGTAPTATQHAIAGDLQSIADAVRRAETAAVSPAKFAAELDALAAFLPALAPYIADAKLAYAAAFTAGNLTIAAGEALAQRYDS